MSTKNITERITAELRAEMARKRITQTELAPKLHISQRALSLRLNGERKMSWGDTYDLAMELGVTLSEIVQRAERADSKAPAAA